MFSMTVGPGDELKKCPFCNKDGKRSSGDEVVFLLCGCIPDHVCNEHDNDANVDFKTWQNAHCWKEIDRLTARIKELEGALDRIRTIDAPVFNGERVTSLYPYRLALWQVIAENALAKNHIPDVGKEVGECSHGAACFSDHKNA